MTFPPPHQIAMSRPGVGEAGRTGDWREAFPVLASAGCLAVKSAGSCQICWAHCPDACIDRGSPPVIDLLYCKGCGICAEVCPTDAIVMHPESELVQIVRREESPR